LIGALGVVGVIVFASRTGGAQPPTSGSSLEFNVPAGDGSKITAVVVGYFVPGEKAPAFAFEVPRSQVVMPRAGVMRVPLIVSKLPPGQTYEVRLRTVVGRQRSAWSESSGTFKVPEDGGAPATTAAVPEASTKRSKEKPTPRKTSGRSAVTELKNNPELGGRLGKQFPGVDLGEAATGFRTVRDLGATLFVAANLKIPFQDLKRLTADKGNSDLRRAIATLKPDVDASAETQRALKQSRQAFRVSKKRK
jgi:hypothetical protein